MRPQSQPSPAPAPPELRVLDERYELRRSLGVGGMSEVFLAWDRTLQRDVTIKLLPVESRDEKGLDRFWGEALALAAVESPHVVAVHDVCIDEHRAYLVMRYVRGQTLEELLLDGPLPPERAVRLIGQVLEGLEDLHTSRIVHRDIKPANVLIDWKEHVVLVDLGVACDRRRPSLTPADATFGTPGYMSPEHREHNRVDARSDLYQVGLVALYALTGVEPSIDEDEGQGRVEALVGGVPSGIADVLRRALARDPLRRFASASDMQAALELAVSVEPTAQIVLPKEQVAATPPQSRKARARRARTTSIASLRRRRRTIGWSLVTLVVLLMVLVLLLAFQ